MKTPKTLTIRLFIVIALAVMGVNSAYAQNKPREPFDVYIEYVQSISDYHRIFPSVDFVYGNPKQDTPGFLVVVTPHPENAAVTLSPFQLVSSSNFNVWIEAGQQDLSSGWKRFGLFWKNGQCLQYLDVNRRNTSAFALFISKDEILERVPHGDLHNITPILRFDLRIMFARRPTAKWPLEWACPIAHSATVNQWSLYFYPTEHFLTNKVEWADEGHIYMDQNPKKKFFHSRDLAWQMAGWFFNLGYSEKNYIREKINESHYVIFKLWKDPEHTKPLTFDYFKDTLWPGGFSDDPNMMVKDRNTIAFPHKGFDDWTLMIPWTTINYWWKDDIKATKENHTCFGYYTLTLSNDGKTTATNHDYDYSGWLSIDVGYEEPKPLTEEEIKRKNCKHPRFKMGQEKRGPFSELLPNGCTREYDLYNRWKECLDCHINFDHEDNHRVYTSTRCTRHDMKETSRREVGRQEVRTPNAVVTKKVFEVVSQCQNECCAYKETHREYTTDNAPVPTPRPQIPEQRCPPHYWQYFSRSLLTPDIVNSFTTGRPPYSDATLNIKVGAADCSMFRHTFQGETTHCYISQQPVGRQLWLALNGDNNYLALSATDPGVLNEVTYQEVYDMIDTLNAVVRDSMNMNMLLTLPTADEMKQLIAQKKVRFDTDPVQKLTAFYVDSVEVYDGKDRLVPADKLATAPEGARLRVMVGRMTSSGEVEMVDSSTADATTGIVLKATPFSTLCHNVKRTPGKFYVVIYRQCKLCKKLEVTSENTFRNARYHRPLVDEP